MTVLISGCVSHSLSMLKEKAEVQRDSVQSCPTAIQRKFYNDGDRLVQYLEAYQCSLQYRSNYCNLDSLVTLTSLVSTPFGTMENIDIACRYVSALCFEGSGNKKDGHSFIHILFQNHKIVQGKFSLVIVVQDS